MAIPEQYAASMFCLSLLMLAHHFEAATERIASAVCSQIYTISTRVFYAPDRLGYEVRSYITRTCMYNV